MDFERHPNVFDTNVLLRDLRRSLDDQPSVYRQIMDSQPGGVFITTQVAREIPRKIVESSLFESREHEAAIQRWETEIGPKLRVVDITAHDVRSNRVRAVVQADRDDWPTAALLDALAPAILHTSNVGDFQSVMGPEASPVTTDHVAIASKDIARFVRSVEDATFGTNLGSVAVGEGLRSLRRVIGRDGLTLIALVGLGVIYAYRREIGRAAMAVAGEVGPKLQAALDFHDAGHALVAGTATPSTLAVSLADRVARATAIAGTFSRSVQALEVYLNERGASTSVAEIIEVVSADRWLHVEAGEIYLGVPFARWLELAE